MSCPDVTVTVPPPDFSKFAEIIAKSIGEAAKNAGTSPGTTCPPPPPNPPITVVVPPNNKLETCPDPPDQKGIALPDFGPGNRIEADLTPLWGDPNMCDGANALVTGLGKLGPREGGGKGAHLFPDFLEGLNAPWEQVKAKQAENPAEAGGQIAGAIYSAPLSFTHAVAQASFAIIDAVDGLSVPNLNAAAYYAGRLGMATWAERVTGMPLSYLYQSDLYAYQFANPQYIPDQANIDRMWLTNYITDEQWDCLTKAQGNTLYWHDLVLDSKINRMSLGELIQLYLRKHITIRDLTERAKKVGWMNVEEQLDALKLAVQLPTQSDLLRMMVRDAADDGVAAKYQYDKDFNEKFSGQLRAWSEAQGVPAEIFKYFWRAHWQIPSNTALYEMLHRLRPDRPEVARWNAAAAAGGVPAAIAAHGPRPQVVTVDDVRTAMEVNDMAPAWVDALLAVSYHPLTRTDATRAYIIGSITKEQLHGVMLDNGYNAADATLLVKFYEELSARRNRQDAGALTTRKIAHYYRKGAMARWEADAALAPIMVDPEKRDDLLNGIDVEVQADNTLERLKALKKRYIAGEDIEGGWGPMIQSVVIDPVRQDQIERQWTFERDHRLKETTAMQLRQWYMAGVISPEQMMNRLERLGYTADDAKRIAQTADIELRRKLEAEARKRKKEALAEARRVEAERLKRLKENCNPPKLCNPDGTPLNQAASNSSGGSSGGGAGGSGDGGGPGK